MSINNLFECVSMWFKRHETAVFLYACFVIVVSFSLELLIKYYAVIAHNDLVGVFLMNVLVFGGTTLIIVLILGSKMKWFSLLLLAAVYTLCVVYI
jgi:hypothetical protein